MPKESKKKIQSCGGMENYLAATNSTAWKKYHNNRTCHEAYCEIKKNLETIQETVVSGAMNESIQTALLNYKVQLDEINSEPNVAIRSQKIQELFAADPVVFLNDHGPAHIDKVIERANSIVTNFSDNNQLTEFEVFLLLCAIQIHDIGNILGRAGHERKLSEIFVESCKNIVIDVPEQRIIKSIAMTHGGKSRLGKDTISLLSSYEKILNSPVHTRLLAAILRFSDELADDSSRANRAAIDLGILSTNSIIYHCYSRALHTVSVEKDDVNNDCKVLLVYELETESLKEQFQVGGSAKYLLDEIYDRTMKMEVERRYCMKFMHPYINIGRIEVNINIYGRTSERVQTISYTLEDVAYPDTPIIGRQGIKEITEVPTGEELLKLLIARGEISGE